MTCDLINTRIAMAPCPFCKGPPQPIVQDYERGGEAAFHDDYGDDGLIVKAFVFCHECGAEGPSTESVIYSREEYLEAEAAAVILWQQRDARHSDLFAASAAEGLNLYPRPDHKPARRRGEQPA